MDNVSYQEACETFEEMDRSLKIGMNIERVPYNMGVAVALFAGLASFPLCFHLPTVEWFNESFVTTEVPPPADLETWLETGSWAWNWMEPPLGQISFFILCTQFARERMDDLGFRPYRSYIKSKRAMNVVDKFPKYESSLIVAYCESIDYVR